MKKFIFTLQRLYDVKCTVEDELYIELEGLIKRRDSLEKELARLKMSLHEQQLAFDRDCKKGMRPIELQNYGAYFEYLMDAIKKQQVLIDESMREVADCQKRLLTVINEKKVLDRIREEQRLEYMKEVDRDSEKMIEDFMANKVG